MTSRFFLIVAALSSMTFALPSVADDSEFIAPALELSLPTGARPTSENVRIVRDFNGMSPSEALALVLSREAETLHPENESFVSDIILQTHKLWTLALNNVFVIAPNPARTFAETQLASGGRLTFVGVMSAVNPVWARVDHDGGTQWFVNQNGRYAAENRPIYHILFEAEVRYSPEAGIKTNFPTWSDPRLAQPIRGQIIESP